MPARRSAPERILTGDRPAGSIVLVTGATGYVGGRLVPRLLEEGWRVRCATRDPRKLQNRPWTADPRVEIVQADVADAAAMTSALRGCRAAYYLVHSMIVAGEEYREQDRRLAESFVRATDAAGVERIVYLGGLGEMGEHLSEHLRSRREVEHVLASGRAKLTVLRAAMIIGSGSASFEILRYLVERLPVMITPRWVGTPAQPVAIRDALHYLVAALDVPETAGLTLDIGGPDVLSYRDILQVMAEVRGLPRRWILPVPVLTPKLSALWIHHVTPVGRRIARPLAEGLRNPVLCRDDRAHELMPHRRMTIREAIEAADARTEEDRRPTTWLDAGPVPGDPDWAGGQTFRDRRGVEVAAPPEVTFGTVCRIGGRQGWYSGTWLWKLRGALDRSLGGPGLSRGRRRADQVHYGDVLDFWRVADVRAPELLRLRAEMRLPGIAELEFRIAPSGDESRLEQTARFRPRGLGGLLYWGAVLPFHGFVFRSMLRGIRRAAERAALERTGDPEPREADPEPRSGTGTNRGG